MPVFIAWYACSRIGFLRAYRADTFHGKDTRTVYRKKKNVRALMLRVTMSEPKMTRAEAKVRLSTEGTFPSRTTQTGTVLVTPSEKLRAIIPHFMSALKQVAARAFYEKYNAHDPNKEGIYVTAAYGRETLKLTKQACLPLLWENAFLVTVRGRLCMQAVLNSALSKWDDINAFLVPVSVDNKELYYEVTVLFYMLVALKVSPPFVCLTV